MKETRRGLSKAEQREATVSRLLEVARHAFATQGYAGAATEDIVQRAEVTRGALYHHFGSKEGLFRAVLAKVHEEVGVRVAAAAYDAPDDWEGLRCGCRAFLAAANDPAIQRIMLVDGPAVLGWSAWRRMDESHSMQLLQEHLAELMQQRVLRERPAAPLAHLLSGAMNELALWIAQQPCAEQALDEAWLVLDGVLSGLRRE